MDELTHCSLHLERVEKPVKCVKSNFVLNLHCFSQYLGGNFGTIYLVILRNCRQSVNTPKWNRFVSVVVSVVISVLFLGKPIKDEALMGSFHARLHNGKAKVLLDLTRRVSQVELHPSTISN